LKQFGCSFVGRFQPRNARLKEMGETRKFTNVFVKNFGDDMTEEKLQKMFEQYGEISSVAVRLYSASVCS
jgi:polyadenylate-binding protein